METNNARSTTTTTTNRLNDDEKRKSSINKHSSNITQVLQELQEAFERDVAHVLRELRPWQHDPTVPGRWNRRPLSFTNYWGLEEWEQHSSRWRHWRHVWQWHRSRLLRSILPQLSFLFLWSLGANHCWARLLVASKPTTIIATAATTTASAWQQIPLTALSLISTFVAALQALRSNQGLARLTEARLALGQMVLHTRDTAMLWSTYIYPHDPILSWRAARHLALWGWVLKAHFRETDTDDIVEAMLQCHPDDLAYCQMQRKRPVAVLMRLRQMIHCAAVERQYIGTTEHRLLEDNLKQLNQVIMQGERIRASPVPPVYSSHASRLMTVYLLSLPWALRGAHLGGTAAVAVTSESLLSWLVFGECVIVCFPMHPCRCGVLLELVGFEVFLFFLLARTPYLFRNNNNKHTVVVGFAMLGLDEMSHMFEQPFKYMPLYHLAKVSMLDVADAFCMRPPALDWNQHEEKDSGNNTNKNSSWKFRRPLYWHVRGRDPRLPYDGSDVPMVTETLNIGP